MSPEQARGIADWPEERRLVLCVVLDDMITGKRPFEGPNHGAILFSVFSAAPEPAHLLGGGDGALWEILRKGLAKDTAERWQSMRQLGRALAVWVATKGVTADAAGTSLEHHWLGERDSLSDPAVECARPRCGARPRTLPPPTRTMSTRCLRRRRRARWAWLSRASPPGAKRRSSGSASRCS